MLIDIPEELIRSACLEAVTESNVLNGDCDSGTFHTACELMHHVANSVKVKDALSTGIPLERIQEIPPTWSAWGEKEESDD